MVGTRGLRVEVHLFCLGSGDLHLRIRLLDWQDLTYLLDLERLYSLLESESVIEDVVTGKVVD